MNDGNIHPPTDFGKWKGINPQHNLFFSLDCRKDFFICTFKRKSNISINNPYRLNSWLLCNNKDRETPLKSWDNPFISISPFGVYNITIREVC